MATTDRMAKVPIREAWTALAAACRFLLLTQSSQVRTSFLYIFVREESRAPKKSKHNSRIEKVQSRSPKIVIILVQDDNAVFWIIIFRSQM